MNIPAFSARFRQLSVMLRKFIQCKILEWLILLILFSVFVQFLQAQAFIVLATDGPYFCNEHV